MISIIIPCYNAAATLGSTIESALSQDVPKEVIVVNDGSTDTSERVISAFGGRIRSFETQNRGASAARTAGTDHSAGQYIQYLDSDDLLTEGTLAARLKALEASGADVAHTDWQKFTIQPDGGEALGAIVRPDVAAIDADAEIATATSLFWAPPAALLYRREIVDRIGGWHPMLPVIQDARFMFDAAARGARFIHVPGVGARYLVSSGSLSRRSIDKFVSDCSLNAREIESLWRSRGPLSVARAKALADMWRHVAAASLLNGLEHFGPAREGYNRVAPRRFGLEAARFSRTVFGSVHTATILRTALRMRAFMRRASA